MLPSTPGVKETDSNMDEMTKLINNLSTKISRLEMENKTQNTPTHENDNQNPNQFRRPFNPRFFPRGRRNNEEQNIQPPF